MLSRDNTELARKKFFDQFKEKTGKNVLSVEFATLTASLPTFSLLELEPPPGQNELAGLLVFCEESLYFYVFPTDNIFRLAMQRMAGDMENDLRKGEWISYFPDGKVQSTGVFKDGVRIGPARVYHENGQILMDGFYTDDHKCGEWVFYDEQGYEVERMDFGPCDYYRSSFIFSIMRRSFLVGRPAPRSRHSPL